MTTELINCEFCNYTTYKKYNLIRHQNAKHNKNINQNTENNENVVKTDEDKLEDELEDCFYCKKCNKKYKTKKYLTTHEINCTGLSILACPKCKKIFSNTSNKSKHIKNNKCKEPVTNNQNNTPNIYINGNNNLNNTTNNYIINNYNSERTDYINFDDIIKLFLNSGDFIIPKYIEMKHFNDKYPENHNIKYQKNRGCIIKEDNKWKFTNIDCLANDLFNKNSNELKSIYDKDKERIENKIRDLELIEFIYSRLNYLDLSMDKHIFKNIKIEIKNIIKSTLLY
jgi:uncharacterized protein YbaR (Trm112 family)